jgi:N-acetylglucosaminyldiphosphoundecaprenol N-acetyl-beta-D-mannosaminyltransferase
MLGGTMRARITGSDIFDGLLTRLDREGGARVFLLGSTEETLVLIQKRIGMDFPNIRVVGTCSPPYKPAFSSAEVLSMVDTINAVEPDVLWVGMTAPKQETWLHENSHRLRVPVAAAIGAVFDFYSGRIRRSHPLFRRAGMEWLPRLLQEPRRLWRRMVVSAPVFMFDVLRERLHRRR